MVYIDKPCSCERALKRQPGDRICFRCEGVAGLRQPSDFFKNRFHKCGCKKALKSAPSDDKCKNCNGLVPSSHPYVLEDHCGCEEATVEEQNQRACNTCLKKIDREVNPLKKLKFTTCQCKPAATILKIEDTFCATCKLSILRKGIKIIPKDPCCCASPVTKKPEDKNCVWCTKLITEGRNYRILPDTNKKVPCIFHVRRFGHSDSCHNCQAKIDSSETVKAIGRNFEPKNPCKCAKAHKAKANSQDCSTCLKQIAQRGHLTAQIFGVCSCAEPVFKGLYCTNCLGKKPRNCSCFCPVKEILEKDYCFYCYQTIHPDRDLKQTKDFVYAQDRIKEKKWRV